MYILGVDMQAFDGLPSHLLFRFRVGLGFHWVSGSKAEMTIVQAMSHGQSNGEWQQVII